MGDFLAMDIKQLTIVGCRLDTFQPAIGFHRG